MEETYSNEAEEAEKNAEIPHEKKDDGKFIGTLFVVLLVIKG